MHHPFTRPKAEDMPLFEAKKFPEFALRLTTLS